MKHWFLYLPFLVQILVISFDEFYFHIKRGLPKWERIGHPLDTFSIALCFLFVLFVPYSLWTLSLYAVLGIISCLFVTKDEFVHKEHCCAKEQWLHALLFLNHPLVLISMGWMWAIGSEFRPFLMLQLSFVLLFAIYQLVFWNLIWKEKQ